MGSKFDQVMNGEVTEKVVSFWFALLGYVAAITTIEVLASKVDSLIVWSTAIISWGVLLFWLQVQMNRMVWFLFPRYSPANQRKDDPSAMKRMVFGGSSTAMVAIALYCCVNQLVSIFVALKFP